MHRPPDLPAARTPREIAAVRGRRDGRGRTGRTGYRRNRSLWPSTKHDRPRARRTGLPTRPDAPHPAPTTPSGRTPPPAGPLGHTARPPPPGPPGAPRRPGDGRRPAPPRRPTSSRHPHDTLPPLTVKAGRPGASPRASPYPTAGPAPRRQHPRLDLILRTPQAQQPYSFLVGGNRPRTLSRLPHTACPHREVTLCNLHAIQGMAVAPPCQRSLRRPAQPRPSPRKITWSP